MKSCPYCGKEYPDDATICSIDRNRLTDNNSQPPIPNEQIVNLPVKNAPYLTFPDYQWSAKDSWKCLGTILALTFVMAIIAAIIIVALHVPHTTFQGGRFGYFFVDILFYATYLASAIYFARTKTFVAFLDGFGLNCKISEYAWFGVIMALIIRCHGHFYGWGKVSSHDIVSFENTAGFVRYLFLIPLLLFAPFIEELVNRGFLYKSFRGSYSREISMVLIVVWTIITHWPQCHHSPPATFDLSVLTIVQCYLREKSGSLWDCILCHFTFNASLLAVSFLK